LTDLAGAVSGGIGFAASANLNPARTGPSLFEPVHGAAHDIAGTGKANPIAAIRSAALMLEYLGEIDAAERIVKSITAYSASSEAPLGSSGSPHSSRSSRSSDSPGAGGSSGTSRDASREASSSRNTSTVAIGDAIAGGV
ncbi:MAG TPA: isocitrate/isopropylmalate family dehydrogenase, partial [Acidimicrobiales bacterium]|nr:isocitrate/isopropylmalate family dehydrogenase [Acidimicrobiales bacterium]